MITLPTGENVATKVKSGDHYQQLLLTHNPDSADGPLDVSDQTPLPAALAERLFDAFSRLRIAEIHTLGDFKQVVETHNPLIWSEKTVGGGNSIYVSSAAAQRLQVGTGSTDSVIRQTKRYYRYSPGKSALVVFTALFRNGQNNTVKRGGFFDDNNGLFFEQNINDMRVVVRSNTSGSVVDAPVAQADWNMDTLDGSGDAGNPSGATLDTAKAQIHIIDFQWLGMGRIRFGYFIDDKVIYVHESLHANRTTKVYMRTPNLPMRFEVSNTNTAPASATFDQICYAVFMEGGGGSDGIRRGIDTVVTGRTFGAELTPIITLRPNASNIRATITDIEFEILASANYRWAALLNPSVADDVVPSWVTPSDSIAEYDITREGAITGGYLLRSGYSPNKGDIQQSPLLMLVEDLGLYANIDGVPDELVLAAQKLSGGTDTAHAAMNWRELI